MGLHVYIYRDETLGGCSNHGVSDIKTRPHIKGLTITNIEAPFEPSEEYPAAKLIVEKHFKYPTVRVVPQELLNAKAWSMMGGSYVATSDSRFNETIEQLTGHTFYGAVALHDRTESASYIRSMD
tara:strand:- start:1653 stop:2027 length:375 start_codon:yes stop_codon:yes gene_type:complete